MVQAIGDLEPSRALRIFGDWTDRVAKGELSVRQAAAPRPASTHVVVTLWDWATPTSYMHDLTSTDKRNPTLNVKGIIYGSPELSSRLCLMLDPTNNKSGLIRPNGAMRNATTKRRRIYAPRPIGH